ncbi:MAG: ADP-ribosylglycohydrolase family protein [Oscillatoriales cyanobacterium C42_A2020_001]|nr:ADP-ribosylglycohydrolase family protein [Leptolyngbyaceae cyanobacterium C42_A2020_001]
MNYSLFSRFQGCLWGMALGECFSSYAVPSLSLPQEQFSPPAHGYYTPVALRLLAAMIAAQTWKPTMLDRSEIKSLSKENLTDAALAIASLPVMLFYHDDLNRQRQALGQIAAGLQQDNQSREWVTIFAYAVSQALKGHLDPNTFVDQSQAYMRVTTSDAATALEEVLEQLEQIKRGYCSLEQTAQLTNPIAIAIACFLHTPYHFPLALLRVSQISAASPSINALTGALSGAYNSSIGIPATWQLPQTLNPISSPEPIHALAAQLLAAWSGVYVPSKLSNTDPLPVAAPWVVHFP